MHLQELATAIDGQLQGLDVEFNGVSIDTRTLRAGELFVALHGPNFDGHTFLPEAGGHQAAGAMVSHSVAVDIPQVTVSDTRIGLGRLAGYWRDRFEFPVIAVTGSNGKTTVKEMIGSILRQRGQVLVSSGNLNNDIGLPLVLCRLRREHAFAVVEMGMNHRGEIDYLTHLARPQVALITNAAQAHLEGLGSVDAVAESKAEIFNGLCSDGTAVINADDQFAGTWRRRVHDYRCITFGIEQPADVTVDPFHADQDGSALTMHTPIGACEVGVPLAGRHNVSNALAAAAAALAVGSDLGHIRRGLESMAPVTGRLQIRDGRSGAQVIDDTYNANPGSMSAAVELLTSIPGEKILVVGDMLELGEEAEALHSRLGDQAREAGIDQLLAFGPLSRFTSAAFGKNGRHFTDKSELIDALLPSLDADTTVLVKGSRGLQMEDIVQVLTDSGRPH